MSCAECKYARAEKMERGKTALRCFSRRVDPAWYGRVVLVVPEDASVTAYNTTPPKWCVIRSRPAAASGD